MKRSGWIHIALCALIVVLALALRKGVVHVVTISGSGCEPQLMAGDRVAVLRSQWLDTIPRRGDIVTFTHPFACGCLFVGRVASEPGDTLWIDADGNLSERSKACDLVVVPKAGQKLSIDIQSIRLYNQTIRLHEPAKSAIIDGLLYVSGEPTDSFSFANSYYWIEANLPEQDSRTLGLVPVGDVCGTVTCILYSHDPDMPCWRGWRWERLIRFVERPKEHTNALGKR